jgi:hypothetical protein
MADIQNARETERVDWDQARPAGDEKPSAAVSRKLRGISGGDWAMFGAIAVIAFATGIVNALSAAQDAAWRGASYDSAGACSGKCRASQSCC